MLSIKEKIEEVKKEMNSISIDLVTDYSGSGSYICDAISEAADNNVSIYYNDIENFMKDHIDLVNDAIDEFGWDGCGSDLHKAGQTAEFLYNERQLYEDFDNIILLAVLYDLLENHNIISIDGRIFDNLYEDCIEIDHNDRFEDITDQITKWFLEDLPEIIEIYKDQKVIENSVA